MKTRIQVSDLQNFYTDTYFGKGINSSFIKRTDIIEAEPINLFVNEWATKKYKAHLIQLESHEELDIPVGIPEKTAVLHFVCKENMSLLHKDMKTYEKKENTNNICGNQGEGISHQFSENRQYEYFKVFLTEESILLFNQHSPDSIRNFENLLEGEKPLGGNCCLTTLEMQQVISQIKKSQNFGNVAPLYFESKVQELLCLHLLQENNQKCDSCSKYSHYSDQVNAARNIIENQYQKPPTIHNLARMVGMSATVLKSSFKVFFGTTIYGYLFDYRMNIARKLLYETSFSVAEIAERSGYEHASHFTIAFKRRFGISPVAFRKKVA